MEKIPNSIIGWHGLCSAKVTSLYGNKIQLDAGEFFEKNKNVKKYPTNLVVLLGHEYHAGLGLHVCETAFLCVWRGKPVNNRLNAKLILESAHKGWTGKLTAGLSVKFFFMNKSRHTTVDGKEVQVPKNIEVSDAMRLFGKIKEVREKCLTS